MGAFVGSGWLRAGLAEAQVPPLPVSGPLIEVQGGAFDPQTQIEVMEFLPKTVHVPVGGAIRWQMNGFHNAAFTSGAAYPPFVIPVPGQQNVQVNPLVAFPVVPAPVYEGIGYYNSGLPPEPGLAFEFTLTFGMPGIYEYACIVHPNMKAYVEVDPPGVPVPAQAAVTAQGQAEAQQYIAAARPTVEEQQATRSVGPAATTIWTSPMDIPNDPHVAAQRFFPQNLTVQIGDTVRWVNQALTEPHTVTFRAGTGREPEFVPVPQAPGPPMLVANPPVFAPVVPPGPYDGTVYANSGFLGPDFPFGLDFSLTFSQPGTYAYVCVLHEPLGMAGFITVQPAGSQPGS